MAGGKQIPPSTEQRRLSVASLYSPDSCAGACLWRPVRWAGRWAQARSGWQQAAAAVCVHLLFQCRRVPVKAGREGRWRGHESAAG